MEFYVLKDIQEGKIKSTGITIEGMLKVLKAIEKQEQNKTMEELEPYNIVYLLNSQFVEKTDVNMIGKVDNEEFALIKNGKLFEIEQSDQKYFVMLANGNLNIAKDMELLKKLSENQDIIKYSEVEKKAYDWLENGETGLSSLVICNTLLPNIKHNKIEKLKENYPSFYPYDTSDFKRCLGLLEAVPELRKDLKKLNEVNKQWKNLVQEWDEIEKAIKEDRKEEAHNLIKKCINLPKMKNR